MGTTKKSVRGRRNIRRVRLDPSKRPKIEWPDTVQIGHLEFCLRTEKEGWEARYTCDRRTLNFRHFNRKRGPKPGPMFTVQYDVSGMWARGSTLKEACRKLHQGAMREFKSLAKLLDYEVEK